MSTKLVERTTLKVIKDTLGTERIDLIKSPELDKNNVQWYSYFDNGKRIRILIPQHAVDAIKADPLCNLLGIHEKLVSKEKKLEYSRIILTDIKSDVTI